MSEPSRYLLRTSPLDFGRCRAISGNPQGFCWILGDPHGILTGSRGFRGGSLGDSRGGGVPKGPLEVSQVSPGDPGRYRGYHKGPTGSLGSWGDLGGSPQDPGGSQLERVVSSLNIYTNTYIYVYMYKYIYTNFESE